MSQNMTRKGGTNPNELTIENSAPILIDHQPGVALCASSLRQDVLVNNVAGLARCAKLLGVPTVLTTVGARGSILAERGGAPAMLTDFVMAQVKAGLVPLPESLRSLAGVKS
jgi:nicotinamidase-related amidase